MGMMKRIGSIFKAKANTAVEKAERNDPVGIAKAELREMQEDLAKFESAIKQASGQKILLEKKIKTKEQSGKDWKNNAKVAKENNNDELAIKAAEKSIEFSDEAKSLKATLKSTEGTYNTQRSRFEAKRKEIGQLESKIKNAEVSFKVAKSMNDLESSETGIGEKSADRINEMLGHVDTEVAMSEASLDIDTNEDQKLEDEINKMSSSKKAEDLLKNL